MYPQRPLLKDCVNQALNLLTDSGECQEVADFLIGSNATRSVFCKLPVWVIDIAGNEQ